MRLLATASRQIGRIDLQISWLNFIKSTMRISSQDMAEIENDLNDAR